MSRSRELFMVCTLAVLAESLLGSQTSSAQTASPQASAARTACASDVQKLCAGVQTGGGRILACLKQHKDEVSDGCKQAILAAMGRSSGDAGSAAASPAAPSAPAVTTTPAAAPPPPAAGSSAANAPSIPSKQNSHASPTASAVSGQHYFLMKQVKIIDQGLGQGKPAYDLMIPKDWQFKGAVNVHEAQGGCFGDWFSVFGVATSPDNSVEFQIAPQFTWQYMDDPAGQQQMQTQNQTDAKYGMKPCPVRAPIKAEEFLRKDMIPNCTKACRNTTVVSVEAFPELEEMVRHQLGMPPGNCRRRPGQHARRRRSRAHRLRRRQRATGRGMDGGGHCRPHNAGRRSRRGL